jgi:hypothetical protein
MKNTIFELEIKTVRNKQTDTLLALDINSWNIGNLFHKVFQYEM